MIYLIGSLRCPRVLEVAQRLRDEDLGVFDDWYAAGEKADDSWQAYEKQRGHSFKQALNGIAATHVFEHDKKWLTCCTTAVLVLPAGKSGHLELGWFLGQGKPGLILTLEEPDRYDVMYKFATAVHDNIDELAEHLHQLEDIPF